MRGTIISNTIIIMVIEQFMVYLRSNEFLQSGFFSFWELLWRPLWLVSLSQNSHSTQKLLLKSIKSYMIYDKWIVISNDSLQNTFLRDNFFEKKFSKNLIEHKRFLAMSEFTNRRVFFIIKGKKKGSISPTTFYAKS